MVDRWKCFPVLFWHSLTVFLLSKFFGHFLDEPTLTLDQSTLHIIPCQLRKLLVSLGPHPTQIEAMNAIVICAALEAGFIGDWCFDDDDELTEALKNYALSWYYSFDRRLVMDFAKMPPVARASQHQSFKLTFANEPILKIHVHCLDGGELLLVSANRIENSVMSSTYSIALPVSRYVVSKTLNFSNLPSSFRNINELSISLKNDIFLPIRNSLIGPRLRPALGSILRIDCHMILRYLKKSDLAALAVTCKEMYALFRPYMIRKIKAKTK